MITKSCILHVADLLVRASDDEPAIDYYSEWFHSLSLAIKDQLVDVDCDNLFLVISGDVASTASASEYDTAYHIMSEVIDSLKIDREKVIMVPGNHDVVWQSRRSTALREESKLRQFHRFSTRLSLPQIVSVPYVRTFETHNLAFVAIDSTSSESTASSGRGCVSKAQLRALTKHLQQAELSNSLLIAVSHHGLDPRIAGEHCIINPRPLITFFSEWRVDILLHAGGHGTSTGWSIHDGPWGRLINIAAGTVSPELARISGQAPHCNVIEIENSQIVELRTIIYDLRTESWVEGLQEKRQMALLSKSRARPVLYPDLRRTQTYSRKLSDLVEQLISGLSLSELQDLVSSLAPALSPYNPILEPKADFVRRVIDYFERKNSTTVLDEAASRILATGLYSRVLLFISAAPGDTEMAESVAERLRDLRYRVWFHGDEIHPGDCISERVSKAVRKTDLFLILWSKHTPESESSWSEIQLVLRRQTMVRTHVIVLRLDESNIPSQLAGLPAVDFSTPSDISFYNLVDTIRAAGI